MQLGSSKIYMKILEKNSNSLKYFGICSENIYNLCITGPAVHLKNIERLWQVFIELK